MVLFKKYFARSPKSNVLGFKFSDPLAYELDESLMTDFNVSHGT